MTVTLPTLQSELSAVIEFKNKIGSRTLHKPTPTLPKKNVDPPPAFPFQYDFSVGTIHGTNMKPPSKEQGKEEAKVIEIIDNDDNVSVLMMKTQEEVLALLHQEMQKSKSAIGHRAASGTNPLVSNPTADATPAGATGTEPIAAEGSQIPPSTGNKGRVDGGQSANSQQQPPL